MLSPPKKKNINDSCQNPVQCSSNYCVDAVCLCPPLYFLRGDKCSKGLKLGDNCKISQECSSTVAYSHCSTISICQCKDNFLQMGFFTCLPETSEYNCVYRADFKFSQLTYYLESNEEGREIMRVQFERSLDVLLRNNVPKNYVSLWLSYDPLRNTFSVNIYMKELYGDIAEAVKDICVENLKVDFDYVIEEAVIFDYQDVSLGLIHNLKAAKRSNRKLPFFLEDVPNKAHKFSVLRHAFSFCVLKCRV
ncbi:uncharacterized protein LOC135922535 [Gordionus sp. m RMFG-2023]|uniref:uncharacterized protein LOC135922535 n=1 Tax=Gordionus sp. m RMFG-2023 TaxID=3053472 RepID=UPI0031FBC9C7